MNQILRLVLIIGVLVLATLLLLYVFGFLSIPALISNIKLAAIAFGIVSVSIVAIVLLSNNGNKPKEVDN